MKIDTHQTLIESIQISQMKIDMVHTLMNRFNQSQEVL